MILLSFLSSQVFAQQITMGENPHEEIIIRIGENGIAHVVHKVQGNSYSPIFVKTVEGTMSNFSVTDAYNYTVQYFTIQQHKTVMIPPSERNMTLIKYDLPNVLSFNSGVWKWDYNTPSDASYTDFYFPSGVDMVWVNDRPIYLGEAGLRQHGDEMKFEYAKNEKIVLQKTQWENHNFTVAIRTLSDVTHQTFDQSSMSYSFEISKPNSFVTIVIPQSLIGGTYASHINGNHLLTNVFHNNGTHSWIGVRPDASGTIKITGTTVIPEFPFVMPVLLITFVSTLIIYRVKLNRSR